MDYKQIVAELRAYRVKTDLAEFQPSICEKAADAIETLLGSVKPSGWIKTTDAQPEEGTPVLGYNCGGYVICECGIYSDGVPYWNSTGFGGDPDYWMPLPEPPEREKPEN